MKRILLAAILGGLAMFVWQSVAHMALPPGEAGVKPLNNEPVLLAAFKENLKEPGFFYFPSPVAPPGASKEQQAQAEQRSMEMMRTGPSGILITYPQGRDMSMPKLLAAQFGVDFLAMLLAAALVSWATLLKGYGGRVLFVTLLSLFPTLAVDVPMWNWYGFPTVYMLAQFIVHLVGFFLGGLVVARLVRPALA